MADDSVVGAIVARAYTRMFTLEDGIYSGRVLEFPGCNGEGETLEEAWHDLDEALAGIVDVRLDTGEPIPQPLHLREYSGRMMLRIPPSLHARAVEAASIEGVSLNRWLSDAVAMAAGRGRQKAERPPAEPSPEMAGATRP